MPEVYQLKLSIRHISPMIWRRLLVGNDMTLDQLHDTIQILFKWDNYYLYQFKFFARQFSSRAGSCEDDRDVCLKDFHFHIGESFLYEYNFYCFWQVEVRLENVLAFDTNKSYPKCIAGKGDPPPEDVGGPADYMAWLDDRYSYDTLKAVDTLNEAVYPMLIPNPETSLIK